MRLVQRHGRIDRIGSRHAEVFIRCVFPDARLDDLLGLEERLHRKITQAAAGIGPPLGILLGMPDSTTIKVSVRTRDALRQLADREGLTFDAQLEKLIRRERRRIIGAQLASAPLEAAEVAVLDASAGDVADASR